MFYIFIHVNVYYISIFTYSKFSANFFYSYIYRNFPNNLDLEIKKKILGIDKKKNYIFSIKKKMFKSILNNLISFHFVRVRFLDALYDATSFWLNIINHKNV